jgi:hypothetical protein
MKDLSRAAQIYIVCVLLLGGASGIWYLGYLELDSPASLSVVCLLAMLLQISKIEGTTARSSYNLSWAVYGFSFASLGGPEMLLVILLAHLAEWLWHR